MAGVAWKDQDSLLKELYSQGLSSKEIGRVLHRTTFAVNNRLSLKGLLRKKPKNKWTPETQAEALSLWKAGLACKEIAQQLGFSAATIRTKVGRKPKKTKSGLVYDLAMRPCLGGCDQEFMSDGIWNRVCPSCSEKNEAFSYTLEGVGTSS